MARRPRDWEIPVADQERLDELERAERPVGPLPEPPYHDKQMHEDAEGVAWFWDVDVRSWCRVTPAFTAHMNGEDDWLDRSQRHYCFLGGPKHWQRETFKAMRVGQALTTLDEAERRRAMLYTVEEGDWFVDDARVSTSTYFVRRFNWMTGMRRDFLVYEYSHDDDLLDMVAEFMATYHTPTERRQHGTRGGRHTANR